MKARPPVLIVGSLQRPATTSVRDVAAIISPLFLGHARFSSKLFWCRRGFFCPRRRHARTPWPLFTSLSSPYTSQSKVQAEKRKKKASAALKKSSR